LGFHWILQLKGRRAPGGIAIVAVVTTISTAIVAVVAVVIAEPPVGIVVSVAAAIVAVELPRPAAIVVEISPCRSILALAVTGRSVRCSLKGRRKLSSGNPDR
jgi:hypothetical protein